MSSGAGIRSSVDRRAAGACASGMARANPAAPPSGAENSLSPRHFPKGLDLRRVTYAYVRRVEYLLNTRPRKCLGYRTPHEVLRE